MARVSLALLLSLCVCLQLCSGEKQPYANSFARLLVTNKKDLRSADFCVNYQQFRRTPIAPVAEEAIPVGLQWWDAPNKTNLCQKTPRGSFQGSVVPFQYRVNGVESCARLFRNFSLGAVINFEIGRLHSHNASVGLALVDRGRVIGPKWRDYLFSEYYDRDLNRSYGIPLFYMYMDTFMEKVTSLGAAEDLELRFYRPPFLPIDPALLIIWLLAMFSVTVGGIVAARNFPKLVKSLEDMSKKLEEANGESGSSESRTTEVFGGNDLCPNLIAITAVMCVVAGILLLGFFFRPVMILVFNVLLVIAGSFSIRFCVMRLLRSCGLSDVPLSCSWAEALRNRGFKPPGLVSCIVLTLGFVLCVFWFFTRKHPFAFVLLNGINVCICIHALKGMYFPNLKWLTVLLLFMFIYDVFMVFGTPLLTTNGCSVMVEVASGVDCSSRADKHGYPVAPINMVVPEKMPVLFYVPQLNDPLISCYDLEVEEYHPVMLGLGDIIVPGYLIAFCFTADVVLKSKIGYGPIAVTGYGIGLIATFISLIVTRMAQPALIYLIPFSLLPIILVSACRGQLKTLWTGEHLKTLKEAVSMSNPQSTLTESTEA